MEKRIANIKGIELEFVDVKIQLALTTDEHPESDSMTFVKISLSGGKNAELVNFSIDTEIKFLLPGHNHELLKAVAYIGDVIRLKNAPKRFKTDVEYFFTNPLKKEDF